MATQQEFVRTLIHSYRKTGTFLTVTLASLEVPKFA